MHLSLDMCAVFPLSQARRKEWSKVSMQRCPEGLRHFERRPVVLCGSLVCNRGWRRLLKSAQRTEQLPPPQRTVMTLARKCSWKWASKGREALARQRGEKECIISGGGTACAKARGSYWSLEA